MSYFACGRRKVSGNACFRGLRQCLAGSPAASFAGQVGMRDIEAVGSDTGEHFQHLDGGGDALRNNEGCCSLPALPARPGCRSAGAPSPRPLFLF